MRLLVLGGGGSIPTSSRGPSAYAVLPSGRRPAPPILLDAGSGCQQKLARAGVDFLRVPAVLLSHLHVDHTGELVPIVSARRVAGPGRAADLVVYGPRGLAEFWRRIGRAYGRWVRPEGVRIEIREYTPLRPFRVGPFRIRAFPVEHATPAVALRLEELATGTVLAFSGDAGPSMGLLEAGHRADLFILECTVPDGVGARGHLTPRWAAEVVRAAAPRRVLLAHFGPDLAPADALRAVRRVVPRRVAAARDGLSVTVEHG